MDDFWLHWAFVSVLGLSVGVGLGVDSLVMVSGFPIVGTSLSAEPRLWSAQASSYGSWARSCSAQA